MSRNFDAFSVAATGATVSTTASTSTGGTIPLDSSGNKPRFVRVSATGNCHVRLGIGAQTALVTDFMLAAGDDAVLQVMGNTHYAVIDRGTSVVFNIVALEDS
jgi:hypothetical protein